MPAMRPNQGTIQKQQAALWSSMPTLQNFNSQLGSDGLLKPQYNVTNNVDTRGIEAARTEAYRAPETQSRWATMALSNARDSQARDLAGQNAQARGQLSMQGGLRSGARERLANNSQMQGLTNMQNTNNQVALQDETNRQKWLQMMPQTELSQAQYDAGIQDKNIGRALSEVGAGRDYAMQQYQEKMKGWGAQQASQEAQTAAKQAKQTSGLFGGGGFLGLGCFITTACTEAMGMADDCFALELARKFRDNYMTIDLERSREVLEYYVTAPKIVEKIHAREDAKKVLKSLFWKQIIPFVSEVEKGNLPEAHILYKEVVKKAGELAGE